MLSILLVVSLISQLGNAVEVDLKVSSESEEGEASVFAFMCTVAEYENTLASISLYRQTSHGVSSSRELVAAISVLSPTTPFAADGFERTVLEGEIDSESDSESHLEVLIPDFQVEDLGLYTCEAAQVDEDGDITYSSAEARVAAGADTEFSRYGPLVNRGVVIETVPVVQERTTTAPAEEPVEETTLAPEETTVPVEETTVPVEETTVPVEETTVQVEETTVPVEETTLPVEVTTVPAEFTTVPAEETTLPIEETTVPVEETTVPIEETTVPVEETTAAPEGTTGLAASLVDKVAFLSQRFEQLNDSLIAFEKKLADLGETEDADTNETASDTADGQVVSNFFVYENASYLFIKSNLATDANKAHTSCESRRLYLTEVNDAGELQAIAKEISPYIVPEALVIVAGQKQVDQDIWLYQGSQQQVDFFAWGPSDQVQPTDSGCLALRNSEAEFTMVSVPCTSDQGNFYFLCEHDD